MKAANTTERSPSSHFKSKGQALVYFLGTAAAMSAVFVGVYSVSQITSEKQKIVNAADSAAYSGAITEARILNLNSYTNRAIVANEVFIGQIISLDSWTSYVEKTTDNYETVLRSLGSIPIPGWAQVLTAMAQLMRVLNQIAQGLESAIDGISSAAIPAMDLVMRGWLATLSPAYFPPVMALAAESAARATVAQNTVNFGGRSDTAPTLVNTAPVRILTVTANQTEWGNISFQYAGNGGRANDNRRYLLNVMERSFDDFTVNRPGSNIFLLGTGGINICPIFNIGTEKRGESSIKQFERWEAQDTIELYTATGFKCRRSYIPIGWGRATAADNATRGTQIASPGRVAGQRAYNDVHQVSGWSGVKEVRDVPRDRDGRPTKEDLTYSVVVSKGGGSIPTNEQALFAHRPTGSAAGSPDMVANYNRNSITAIAAAKVFFERPFRTADFTGRRFFRTDGAHEFANQYNPYWQVRLTKLSTGQKAAFYTALGTNPGLALFSQ
jgi:Putative Flp pilus-assembly TadE/G-like